MNDFPRWFWPLIVAGLVVGWYLWGAFIRYHAAGVCG